MGEDGVELKREGVELRVGVGLEHLDCGAVGHPALAVGFVDVDAQGDVDAGKKRDDMAARLSREQLSAENEKVKSFKPKKPDGEAARPDGGSFQ